MARKGKQAEAVQAEVAPEPATIVAYKGFDQNLQCRGYQFEVGQTYEHKGRVAACASGFHACENPLDVLSYYPLVNGDGAPGRFCKVTLAGEIARHGADSKLAAARITLDAELKLPDFIIAGVNWIIDATKAAVKGSTLTSDNGEDGARIGSSGYGARIGSSGYDAQIGSSGNGARIGSSGNGARIGSSGNGARIGSSGNDAQIGSSGNDARIGSSGNGARIGSSGYDAQIGSSGNGARIDSSGERAVIACAGQGAKVRGKAGAWLSVAEYTWNSADARYDCIGFATGCVGQDGIKSDTFYRAENGKLVEV